MKKIEILKNILWILLIWGMICLIVLMVRDMRRMEIEKVEKEYIIVEKNSLGDTLAVFNPATNYELYKGVVTFVYNKKKRTLIQNFTVEEK